MTAIDQADVLALLEERPYAADELAELFEQSVDVVKRALADFELPRCEKCGRAFLRKPLTSGRFCTRACYESGPRRAPASKAGRKPLDHSSRQAAIIRALAAGPLTVGPLSEHLQLTREVTKLECSALKRLGRIVLVARGGAKAWALPAAIKTKSGNQRVGEEGRVYPADVVDHELAEIDELEAEDAGEEVELEMEPPPAVRSQKLLRQPNERPPSQKVEGPPAWWVGAKPDGFTDLALTQLERMRGSREAFKVALRLLQ